MDIAPNGRKTTRSLAFICTIGFFLFQTACGGPAGNPANGEKWFNKNNCFFCHGRGGKNGKAPTIAGLKMRFSSFKNKLRNPDSAIMPEFPEDVISSQDAADIYAWLKNNP